MMGIALSKVSILGATGSRYSIASVQSGNPGNYTVMVSNAAGSATSGIAALAVRSLSEIFCARARPSITSNLSRTPNFNADLRTLSSKPRGNVLINADSASVFYPASNFTLPQPPIIRTKPRCHSPFDGPVRY